MSKEVTTSTGASASAATLTVAATLGLAATSRLLALQRMNGMDISVAARLGPFASFLTLWVLMMAAMMLPGAVPAVLRVVHASGRARTMALFVGSYLAVWALVGVPVYLLYRPHSSLATGVLVIVATASARYSQRDGAGLFQQNHLPERRAPEMDVLAR